MPTKAQIYRYWKPWLDEHLRDSDHIFCWACQREYYINKITFDETTPWAAVDRAWNRAKVLQACHIVPEALGGKETVENLFLLCPECHDLAPDTAFPEQFLRWAANQSHFERVLHKIKCAIESLDIPRNRLQEVADVFHDPNFKAWAFDHLGFHCFQNNSGFGVKFSTSLALASEYLWYLDHTKPGEAEAAS